MKRFLSIALVGLMACVAFTAEAAVTNYKIDAGKTAGDLATAVVTEIGNGYQPIGAAFPCQSGFVCQTMVLGTPATIATYETTEVYNPTVINGGTVTVTPDAYIYNVALHEAATIAGATVNITAGTRNGQTVRITSDHIITTLTLGATVAGDFLTAPTAAAVGDSFIFVWSVAKTKWEYMGDAI